MQTAPLTITGKQPTISTGTRLPWAVYEQVKSHAAKRGVTMSSLICGWVKEKLSESEAKCDKT